MRDDFTVALGPCDHLARSQAAHRPVRALHIGSLDRAPPPGSKSASSVLAFVELGVAFAGGSGTCSAPQLVPGLVGIVVGS